jgi:hypothetical protein
MQTTGTTGTTGTIAHVGYGGVRDAATLASFIGGQVPAGSVVVRVTAGEGKVNGFRNADLARACAMAGLCYSHKPELATEDRNHWEHSSTHHITWAVKDFCATLKVMQQLAAWCAANPDKSIVLLCGERRSVKGFEQDQQVVCHRGLVAKALAALTGRKLQVLVAPLDQERMKAFRAQQSAAQAG